MPDRHQKATKKRFPGLIFKTPLGGCVSINQGLIFSCVQLCPTSNQYVNFNDI
jgi:hypothetical protein